MPAPYSRVLQASACVVARLKVLIGTTGTLIPALSGYAVPDAQFYERMLPWDSRILHPAVLVNPVREILKDGTNVGDDMGHGLNLTITRAANRSIATDDQILFLRQVAIEEFNNRRLAGMTDLFCKVEIGELLDAVAQGANYNATSFIIRATKRYTRTQGA